MRGDLYRLRAPRDVRGHEQAGARFAVVVQSDDLPLSTWVVAPTSTGRREASFRPEIEIDGVVTRVMVEQLTVIHPSTRLGEFAGRLDAAKMQAVDAALLCRTRAGLTLPGRDEIPAPEISAVPATAEKDRQSTRRYLSSTGLDGRHAVDGCILTRFNCVRFR